MDVTERDSGAIVTLVREKYDQLKDTWNQVFGHNSEIVANRSNAARIHVEELFDEMIHEEQEAIVKLKSSIVEKKEKIAALEKALNCEVKFVVDDSLPLLEKERSLNKRLELLCAKKEIKVLILVNFRKEEAKLLSQMGDTKIYLESAEILSDKEEAKFRTYLKKLEYEITRRKEAFNCERDQIKKLIKELGIEGEYEEKVSEILNYDENVKVTVEDMKRAEAVRLELIEQKVQNEKKEAELKEKIIDLGNKLKLNPADVERFLNTHKGFTRKNLDALVEEIRRCQELRRSQMSKFIPQLQRELSALWKKCGVCPEEKQDFEPFFSTSYTEEIADALEAEIDKYSNYYKQNQEIYEMIEKRAMLIDELEKLNYEACNSQRLFTNRGGKLLQEEKQRKALTKEIPKIERDLKRLLKQFEERNNRDFVFGGKCLLTVIEDEQIERAGKKKGTPSTPAAQMGRFKRITKIRTNENIPPNKQRLPATTGRIMPERAITYSKFESVPHKKLDIKKGSKTPLALRKNPGLGSTQDLRPKTPLALRKNLGLGSAQDLRTLWKETPTNPKTP